VTLVDVEYDSNRWIRVPLDYVGTRWTDAASWADWLADEATRGRPDAETVAPVVRDAAQAVALFPAPHVWGRFWHYPIDGVPTGFVDVYIETRTPDGTDAADLLPDTGFTAVTPVLDRLDVPGFAAAVRRRSLVLVLRHESDDDPVPMPRVEWLGIGPQWVCYIVTNDHDPAAANARAADTDVLFAAVADAARTEASSAGSDGGR
jgi:hypothetical protein